MATATFTSKYFTPVLAERELERVQTEEAQDALRDDNLTVKVLPNVSEVKATVSRHLYVSSAELMRV